MRATTKVVALLKGVERYVFLYDDESTPQVFEALGRAATNPELSFTWYDAATLSRSVHRLAKDVVLPLLLVVAMLHTLLHRNAHGQEAVSVHLTLGNPSKALPDESSEDNFLIVHDQFACSYNSRLGTPNWVSWRLSADDLGRAGRDGEQFTIDGRLPKKWPPVSAALFNGSGFDRGHGLPAGDRSRRLADVEATFSTANLYPQAPRLNRGAMNQIEQYRRQRAKDGDELYIVTGPAGSGGFGEKGHRLSIGGADARRINVPAYYWMAAIAIPDKDGNDLRRIGPNTPALAVVLRNDQNAGDWHEAITTVNDIEQLTDLDLFDLLPDDVETEIESKTGRP